MPGSMKINYMSSELTHLILMVLNELKNERKAKCLVSFVLIEILTKQNRSLVIRSGLHRMRG